MEALSAPSSWVSNHPDWLQAGDASQSRFKLMLVHDGYQHLDQAIKALQGRDFPSDSEVLLLSVADLFRTPLHLVGKDVEHSAQSQATRSHSRGRHKKTQALFDKLEWVSRQARARLQAAFPDWRISFEQPLDWQPNLIFLGVYGQSSIRNPGLGEIIRKMSTESNIPFIVARPQRQSESTGGPSLIAFDGPASAAAILQALQRRPTHRGSNFHLVFYKDPLMAHAERWSAGYEEPDRLWIDNQLVRTKTAIEALGHKVSRVTASGNTADAILKEAKRVDAESVLLGTGSLANLGSLSNQSIAVTVAAQADCSVEIVFSARRPRPAAALQASAIAQSIVLRKRRNEPSPGVASSI